jgi:hypothetical protein
LLILKTIISKFWWWLASLDDAMSEPLGQVVPYLSYCKERRHNFNLFFFNFKVEALWKFSK